MIPEIDDLLGLSSYSTTLIGCGGSIRNSFEDFEVNEIISSKTKSSIKTDTNNDDDDDDDDHSRHYYPIYSLKKTGIDTNHALSGLLKKTGLRLHSLGLKDSNAVTTQYVYSTSKSKGIKKFESSKYTLTRLGYTSKPLSKKHMIGNRFKIAIRDNTSKILYLDNDKILNYYGYQRFGSSRPVTHLIGKAIVQRNYRDAIDYILSFTSKFDSSENNNIRKELSDPSNYSKIFDSIPESMDLERIIVSELIKNDNEPLHAIRALPVTMRRFYVQAYQSYLFNLTLSHAFDFDEDLFTSQDGDVCYDHDGILGKHVDGLDQNLAIPIVGYSYYKKTRFHYYISKILEEQEISPQDFYIKELQEASNEGGFRNSSILIKDFQLDALTNTVSFTLSRGSFATIVMREIMKPQNPLSCGF